MSSKCQVTIKIRYRLAIMVSEVGKPLDRKFNPRSACMPKTIKSVTSTTDTEDLEHGSAADRLSSATENYLLCMYRLWEDSESPTVTSLTETLKQLPSTEGLGTSVPSVAGMVRRMQKQGLVDIGVDKKIRLTTKGLQSGEDMARRHRLAEWLVVKLLGMELYQAHAEAHRLEHGISPELEKKLNERLGYPTRSPFGRPIPGTGEPVTPDNAVTMDKAKANMPYVIDRVPEEDPELLRFLVDSLLIPEQEVKVSEAAPYRGVLVVTTKKGTVSMGYNVAQLILVCPT